MGLLLLNGLCCPGRVRDRLTKLNTRSRPALVERQRVGWGLEQLVAAPICVGSEGRDKLRELLRRPVRELRSREHQFFFAGQYSILLICMTSGASRAPSPLGVTFA